MLTSIQVTKESEKFPEIVRLYRAAFPREERVALELLLETDGQEMIYAGFSREQMTEAIYTRNFHMTLLACECIRHDAYCTRLRMQLPPEAREVFGDDMEGIRDVFDVHGKYNANRPQGQKEDA